MGKSSQRATLAQFIGREAELLNRSLWDVFSTTVKKYPNEEAIVSMWQKPQVDINCSPPSSEPDCIRWTYQGLLDASDQLASGLKSLGCRGGSRLGSIFWNSAEWGLLFWAAARIGMIYAPIDPRDPTESKAILQALGPDVMVVQDADGAALVDDADRDHSGKVIYIQCSGTTVKGWMTLNEVFEAGNNHRFHASRKSRGHDHAPTNQPSAPALIIFTSGTTGAPKGCVHSSSNLISQTCDFDPNPDPTIPDRWLVHTPVSHIFAVNNALRAWRYGGTVIFPSKKFDVESTLSALMKEKCSVMSATPTLVRTLMAHPNCPSPDETCLSLISLAATRITPADIALCREGLGTSHAVQAYGMSEGAPLISWAREDELLTENAEVGVGKVLPGAAIRICHPASRRVLSINQVGELHVSGSSVISEYLDRSDSGAFYDDDLGRWLATGDQATVDQNGVVRILGRYKDLIIRGGENINPIKIEQCLEELIGVSAWVVGAQDKLAGEVPVAVVQLPNEFTKAQLYEQAAGLRPSHALAGIYTLEELRLQSVPKTSIGKVKKGELRDAVNDFRTSQVSTPSLYEPRESLSTDGVADRLVTQLVGIWEAVTGCRPSPTTSMDHIADSITLLRYCDAVFRSCGKRLYLQDVVEHDTIAQQAVLLEARDHRQQTSFSTRSLDEDDANESEHPLLSRRPAESGPSEGGRFTWASKSSCRKPRHSAREECLKSEALSDLDRIGLGSSSIEEVLPIRDSLHRVVLGQRPQSYHIRMVFRAHNADSHKIRRGVEKAVAKRPLMRSLVFRPTTAGLYHVVLGPSHVLFERLISVLEVASEDEAKAQWEDEGRSSHLSSLMFRAEVISVRDSENTYLSLCYDHSIVDALSLWPWHKDLDLLIDDLNAEIWEPTPFKLFADLFTQYRNSVPARDAVSFHVNRLRGISRQKQALWPVQKAPGWMISSDKDSRFAEERDLVREVVWNGEWKDKASSFQFPRIGRVVCLPRLYKLKDHGVEPSLFAKSAVVLMNVLKTGSSYAILNTWESGRSWPFVPPWLEEMMPAAMSIDGPTVEWLLNMVEVRRDEPVLGFLLRMAAEAEEMARHQHVPWQKLVKALRDEGDVAIDASFRQSFVWDLSLGFGATQTEGGNRDFKCLEPVARLDWADCGLFWNAFMIDRQSLYFVASWDTAQMNEVEIEECCDILADVMRKLEEVRNWDRRVGDVFQW